MAKHTSVALCFVVLVIGLVIQLVWAGSGDPQKGRAIYEKNCVTCHGVQGKGDGPASKMLTPPPADLSSPKTRAKSESDLLKTIQNGRPPSSMPAFSAQLTEQEIYDVYSYIRMLGR